jgi:hypothetical protein
VAVFTGLGLIWKCLDMFTLIPAAAKPRFAGS